MKKISIKTKLYECPKCNRKIIGYVDNCPVCKTKIIKAGKDKIVTFIKKN